ncbi:hypothetical protein Cgig2_007861 [Carnegiea gigantea]|uniref:Uncharacterized protein n=1 Tax=Carnegiea gigantea TaxID=171969 RepID=A0A9Q1KFS0_9CARY|nr:hypothetical protein Cgig2_007861 [Carnegiea gigantea]
MSYAVEEQQGVESLDIVVNEGDDVVSAFLIFEKEFIDGAAYNYKAVESSSCAMVLHVCCVKQVPDQYIIRRWSKGIKDGQTVDWGTYNGKEHVGCSSVWKMQMMRKMNSIIIASQMNKNATAHCEKYCMELKEVIEFDVGSIHIAEDGQEKDSNSLPNVLNPPGSRQKDVRNKRFKSTVEKKCDQVKQKKSKKLLKTDVGLSSAPPQNGPCCPSALPYTSINYSHMLRQISLPTFNLSSSVSHVQYNVGEVHIWVHLHLLIWSCFYMIF